jgi:hypothetical protein
MYVSFPTVLTFTDVSDVHYSTIIRAMMMQAVSTSETSVNFYQNTRRNIPEDTNLHNHLVMSFDRTQLQ